MIIWLKLVSGSEQKLKLPQSFRSLLEMLWIGAVGDSLSKKFFSAVFPLHVTESFDAQKIAKNLPQVYAVNKIENINSSLTKISRVSLVLVGIAYVAVFLVLIVVYKFKVALKIVRAPVLAGFFVASVFGYLGINFNFFAIVGVILTLGIGIDYALFFREGGRKNQTTALAVILSTATTLISFGRIFCTCLLDCVRGFFCFLPPYASQTQFRSYLLLRF